MADVTPPAAAPTSQDPGVQNVQGIAHTGGATRVTLPGNVPQPVDPNTFQPVDPAANQATPAAPASERPAGLPEGHDSWEAYAKALETANAAGKAVEPPAKEGAADKDTKEGEDKPAYVRPAEIQAQIDTLPEASREKAAPFFDEVVQTGALSDASVKAAAEQFGVTEDMVRDYVAGGKARAEAQTAAAVAPFYEAAGGKEVYDQFVQWAITGGFTPAQMADFDAKLNTPNGVNEVRKAVDAWKASGNGPSARDITRTSRAPDAPTQTDGFKSQQEMLDAMADPRYRKGDAAYIKEVERKVAIGNF